MGWNENSPKLIWGRDIPAWWNGRPMTVLRLYTIRLNLAEGARK